MRHLLNVDFFSGEFPLHIATATHGTVTAHRHEFFELVYLIAGRGTHRIGAESYPIQAGDVYVISPDEPHAYHSSDDAGMHIVNVLFLPRILDETLLDDVALSGLTRLLYIEPLFREEARFAHRLNLQGGVAYRIAAMLQDMEQEQRTQAPGHRLVLKGMFCTLLVLLSRAYEQQITRDGAEVQFARRHAVVDAAISYIEAHHTEAVSLADVAHHMAMSPSRLAHLFKAHTRRSILSYLHEYRIGRICAELQGTNTPVTDLALNLGYGDLRFFHRVFRRYTGCSPTEYRRRFQRGSPRAIVAPAMGGPGPDMETAALR